MLSRSVRVRKEDFETVIKKGGYIQSPFFTIRYLPKTGKSNFAVVISKTVSKSAVMRNKVKRRLWAVISKNHKEFKGGYNIVFFAKKDAENESFKGLCKTLDSILQKSVFFK